MKKRRSKKLRARIEKAIRTAKTLEDAKSLALYGTTSPLIKLVRQFRHFHKVVERIEHPAARKAIAARGAQQDAMYSSTTWIELRRDTALELAEELLDCIARSDHEVISHIADELRFDRSKYDRRRSHILALRGILEKRGASMPIEKLSAVTGIKDRDVLRRLAKELKFPIAASRVGRPRKSDK